MAVTTFSHGKRSYVGIRVTGDPTYTDVSSYFTDSNIPENREEHDTTTYGPTDDKTFQGGNRDRTFDGSGFWNATVEAALRPFVDAESIDIQWGPAGNASGKPSVSGVGFVTKFETPTSANDVTKFSFSARLSGGVTRAAVS